jgi:hypothetical protein
MDIIITLNEEDAIRNLLVIVGDKSFRAQDETTTNKIKEILPQLYPLFKTLSRGMSIEQWISTTVSGPYPTDTLDFPENIEEENN